MNTVTKAALTGAATTAGVIGFHWLYTSEAIGWGLFLATPSALVPLFLVMTGFVAPVAYAAGLAALLAFIWRRP